MLVGRATRVQRHLMALPKRYEAVAQLGATSSTGDTEGEITRTGRVPPDPPALPTVELLQRPPAYSAGKVGDFEYETVTILPDGLTLDVIDATKR